MTKWSLALAMLLAAPAVGQTLPAPQPAAADLLAPEPTAAETVLAFENAQTRMTVPVTIDTRGPWRFVVDTGAERSVVSRELAQVLGLPAGPFVRVISMTGAERVPTVHVGSLGVSTIASPAIVAPALEAHDLGAVGLVGIDALQGHSVVIDFDRDRMTLRPSRRRRAPPPSREEIVVTAKSLFGQLIVTDARWRNKPIAVVIDTGAPMSIGNTALLALIKNARAEGAVSLISATGGTLNADAITVDSLQVGGIGFSGVRMAIADAAPFERFNLSNRPAMLLGMDVLRLFRRVQIDFANRNIRFTLPRGAVPDDAAIGTL
ncbi:MAG TPA: retroviral-like aspartic protease family protein [Sphingomonas sp.]|jgi:predicted aspartyl protease